VSGLLDKLEQMDAAPAPTPAPYVPPHVTHETTSLLGGPEQKTSKLSLKALAEVFTGPAANPFWRGVFQWDEFNERIIAVNPLFRLDAENGGLSERDTAIMQVWLETQGFTADDAKLRKALLIAAGVASFHPVRNYLNGVDEVNLRRMSGRDEDYVTDDARGYFTGDDDRRSIAERLFGTEGEQATRESAILMRQAIAAVRRVRHPGTQVDTMAILVGEQGFRKSSFLRALGGPYFTDQMPSDLSERHADMHLRGKWIVEFPELRHFTYGGNSLEAIKAFLTRTMDKYARMHSEDEVERPRQCVFFGTSNADDCVPDDATGNRRFPIVHVNKVIDLDTFDRDEFWAAAVALEEAGEQHWTDNLAEEEATREAHTSTDAWDDDVVRILKERHAKGDPFVTASDVLSLGLAIPLEKRDKKMLDRVGRILRRLCGPRKVIKVDGRKSVGVYTMPDYGDIPTRVATEPEFFSRAAPAAPVEGQGGLSTASRLSTTVYNGQ